MDKMIKVRIHPDIANKEKFDRELSPGINNEMILLAGEKFEVMASTLAKQYELQYKGWFWRKEWLEIVNDILENGEEL